MLNSQIKSQNPRIRSNTTEITKRKQEARKPRGEDRPGKPGEATTPGERTAGYHSAAVVPGKRSQLFFFGAKKSYINSSILLRTRPVLFDPCSSTIAMLLTTVLLLLLEPCPVAAGIAERAGGAAALFKVIVSSFLVFCHFTQFIVYCPSSRAHFLQSLAMLIQILLF